MRRIVRKFKSFDEQRRADRRYYLGLTPQQRLDILLELIAAYGDGSDETATGFERVYRIVKLRGS